MVDSIKSVLMRRDGMSETEADKTVKNAREIALDMLANGEMPWNICETEFGLEPDYIEELLI